MAKCAAVAGLFLGLSLLTLAGCVDPEAHMDAVSSARILLHVYSAAFSALRRAEN